MKKYNPKEIEPKWQREWENKKLFVASDDSKKPLRQAQGKPKYYALIEFPYLSGDGLHVGHVRSYTAIDIVARKRRMEGYNVLYPIGWDAFGLPAENYAIKTGIHPRETTKKNADTFRRQLKSLGFSFDWDREISTADPEYYKWTQWMFIQFFKHGLAYKANVPINWCKSCKIGLANEEVVTHSTSSGQAAACERCGGEVEKRNKDQWMIKITKYADRLLEGLKTVDYIERARVQQENWIGRSEGASIQFPISNSQFSVEVFTTRPDTLFGATYLVLSPDYSQITNHKSQITNWKEVNEYIETAKKKNETDRTAEDKSKTGIELRGLKAINPATKEEIPIFIADYVLAGYGTGAIMAVPAHDERDFEFARKFNLPIQQVIAPHFYDHANPPRPGKRKVERTVVQGVVKHWSDNAILQLQWKKFPWKTFVIGGAEEGESPEDTIKREVIEETGYKNFKCITKIGGEMRSEWFAEHKNENRYARMHVFYIELTDGEQEPVSDGEKIKHDIEWVPKKNVPDAYHPVSELERIWDTLENGEKAYTGEGIVINSGAFSEMPSEKAREEITLKFGKPQAQYKLRDWVFSRQRYWGEPIPLVFCDTCKKQAEAISDKLKAESSEGETLNPGWFAVSDEQLPVELPEVKNYKPTDTGESPLAGIEEWVNVKCPKCNGPAKRETDVMPNWAGSSWYFISYCIAENLKSQIPISKQITSSEIQNKLKHWMPIDWYNGGMEHTVLHLLYSRFWNMFLYDIGVVSVSEPYKKRTSHGFILGEGGIKMSKSKGNVINPDDLVSEFGADSLRLYEMFIGPFDQTVAWDERGILGPERFLKRVWEVQNRRMANGEWRMDDSGQTSSLQATTSDGKKLEKLLHQTIKKVSDDIENMSFNTAVSTLMIFANICYEKEAVPEKIWRTFLILLAPFAPHITEELWQKLNETRDKGQESVHEEKWPEYNENLAKEDIFELIIQINGKMRGKVSAEMGLTETKAQVLAEKEVSTWLKDKKFQRVVFIKDRLINFIV